MAARSWHRDDGSLVMAVLAAIVVAGLLVVLVSRTTNAQQQVRFDRNHQLAINAADAGLQQALSVITELPAGDTRTTLDSSALDTDLGGEQFSWTAEKTGVGGWQVRSTGQHGDVVRNVEAGATQDPIFFLAAFGRVGLRLVGDNEAMSYLDTATDTGFGAVGSNGLVSIIGNSTADVVMLMGDDASCDDNQYDATTNTCNDNPIEGHPDKLDFPAMIADAEAEIAENCDDADFVPFSQSSHATLQGGQVYCFSEIRTGNGFELQVADGSLANAAKVYVKPGPIEIGNSNRINCPVGSCDFLAGETPESGALQVVTTTPTLTIGNQTNIAAAILAPAANCQGNPSSAQSSIYGSIICHQIGSDGSGNQGGWSFYFDQRLLEIGNGRFRLTDYREEVGGSTSFS